MNYIIQSLFAVVALAVILYFVKVLTHAAIVAALGSSAFIVFAMPHYVTAQPRKLIGGHAVGLLSGTFCYYVFLSGTIGELITSWEFTTLLIYALAVGLSIFLMAITNTEHPPAASTALGIVTNAWSSQVVIFILLSAVGLAVARRLLAGYLRDLI
ncbi:MAG: HPP family protein [Chloroflexi bacterium]|nr:HPP family protein [Chloroflexota bacterium]